MPLITACPACHTQFVVKKEQLKAYEGQVRCGTCQHVFNAKTYLIKSARPKKATVTQVEAVLSDISLTADAPLDEAVTVVTEMADTATLDAENASQENVVEINASEENASEDSKTDHSATSSEQLLTTEANIAAESTEPTVVEMATEPSTTAVNSEHSTTDTTQGIAEAGAEPASSAAFTENAPATEFSAASADTETAAEVNAAPATFANSATIPTTPNILDGVSTQDKFHQHLSKRHFSWPLFALCVALGLVLLGQLLYFMRTEMSAYFPHTKPWLSAACSQLGCKVALPKNIEYLTIDDSDMHEHLDYQQVLVFASTLINHAPYAQAYPTIELTLTNTNDEPVLRRTLSAKDYLPKDVPLAQGIPANSDVYIKLNLNTADIAVAGYRVALNY